MAIKKVQVDGQQYELAGGNGGGSLEVLSGESDYPIFKSLANICPSYMNANEKVVRVQYKEGSADAELEFVDTEIIELEEDDYTYSFIEKEGLEYSLLFYDYGVYGYCVSFNYPDAPGSFPPVTWKLTFEGGESLILEMSY